MCIRDRVKVQSKVITRIEPFVPGEDDTELDVYKRQVHTIRTDKPEQDTAETFVMLHHVGNTGKRGVMGGNFGLSEIFPFSGFSYNGE